METTSPRNFRRSYSRFPCATLAFLLWMAPEGLCEETSAPNLLRNASLEIGQPLPEAWQKYQPDGTSVRTDASVAHSGRRSVAISGDTKATQYPNLSFTMPALPGEVYSATAWCKTEDFPKGVGAYVVLTFLNHGQRVAWVQGEFVGVRHKDWTLLAVQGTVPAGAHEVALGLVVNGPGTAWFDDAVLRRIQAAPEVFSGTAVQLAFRDNHASGLPFLGFGVQGDLFLTAPFNRKHGVTDADIALVRQRVRQMRPHIVRTFFDYQWWQPERDRQTPDSPRMQDYVSWITFLNEIGSQVMLSPWGDYFAYPEWMRDGQRRLPKREHQEAMVRSLVDLLAYLRRDRGLVNVRYLSLMNEPNLDPARPTDAQDLVRLTRLLDQMLVQRGLRKDLFLLGPDSAGQTVPGAWSREVTAACYDIYDAVADHLYPGDANELPAWWDVRASFLESLSRSAGKRKPLLLSEFNREDPEAAETIGGVRHLNNRPIQRYEHGLYLAHAAVESLRHGGSGGLVWCLADTYYDDAYYMKYGLWQYKDNGWKPRPGFYAWSLLTRYSQPGSRILLPDYGPTEAARPVPAVALLSPAGRMTILVVNRAGRELRLSIELPAARPSGLKRFEYSRGALERAGDQMLQSRQTLSCRENHSVVINLAADTFVLLSDSD